MTTRDERSLQVVPDQVEFRGNQVAGAPVSDRFAELVAEAARLDAELAAETARHREPTGARVLLPVTAVATVLLALLGSQPWQLPGRDGGAVSGVPQSLLTFLLLCAAVCVWGAGRLVRPERVVGPGAARVWWGLLAGSAVVSVTAALSLASYAGSDQRPGAVLVRCLVPLVPAVLAGALARADGRGARLRLALGTGVVTVPMVALGWALLASAPTSTAGLDDVLGMTLLSGVAPFALAVAFVAADRRPR